jgi:hypothetical protein
LRRQSDDIAFDTENRKAFFLSSTGEATFVAVQEAIADFENRSIVGGLKYAVNTWTFELVTFVADRHEEDFFTKLAKAGVAINRKNHILKAHLKHIWTHAKHALY